MVSYSRRPQSGQITCYLNRTYHVLLTTTGDKGDNLCNFRYRESSLTSEQRLRVLPSHPVVQTKYDKGGAPQEFVVSPNQCSRMDALLQN